MIHTVISRPMIWTSLRFSQSKQTPNPAAFEPIHARSTSSCRLSGHALKCSQGWMERRLVSVQARCGLFQIHTVTAHPLIAYQRLSSTTAPIQRFMRNAHIVMAMWCACVRPDALKIRKISELTFSLRSSLPACIRQAMKNLFDRSQAENFRKGHAEGFRRPAEPVSHVAFSSGGWDCF